MDPGSPTGAGVNPESRSRTFQPLWDGDSKIVIAIDIGTTSSGVAFTFLERGCKQTLRRVTRWPGQQKQNAQSKVPSLIWYDSNNMPRSFGAEAQTRETKLKAKKKGWELARHFKLHLHPSNYLAKHNLVLEPLPARVPLLQIYSDFLRYLLERTQERFGTSIAHGAKIWQDYHRNMEVVIGHPGRHGPRELDFLRSAVVAAGFTTSDKAKSHVHFVTEAEASVYFCLHYTDLKNYMNAGTNFAVCDAGGSTVDTTVYTVRGVAPAPRLKELRRPACVQAGAIFVDKLAELRLRQLLAKAELSSNEINECLFRGTNDFEMNVKRRFNEATKDWNIEIGDSECSIPALRVRRGKLRLKGSTVQSFFDRCVNEIIASVSLQVSAVPVSYILLVGGFGDSPYLREQLKNHFDPMGIQVITSNNNTSTKAVIDGAIRWYCTNQGSKRAPRYTYGTEIEVPFDQANVEHSGRTQVEKPSGVYVSGKWFQLIHKGMTIDHDSTIRQTYTLEYLRPDLDLGVLNEDIYRYSLDGGPSWLATKSGELLDGFQKVCSVSAELSGMWKALHPRINTLGDRYWALTFNVCFLFGRTRLEAFLEWAEEDAVKTMPANVISDPNI